MKAVLQAVSDLKQSLKANLAQCSGEYVPSHIIPIASRSDQVSSPRMMYLVPSEYYPALKIASSTPGVVLTADPQVLFANSNIPKPVLQLCLVSAEELKKLSTTTIGGKQHDLFQISSINKLFPKFKVECVRISRLLIWKDENIENSENSSILKALRAQAPNFPIYACLSTSSAIDLIRKKSQTGNTVFLLANGANSEPLVQEYVQVHGNSAHHCMIFCFNVQYHSSWARKYGNVRVTGSSADVQNFAKEMMGISAMASPYSNLGTLKFW